MSRLVDPRICPDCRALLDAAATCTSCGLRLTGPAAAELWVHMQQADRLVEELRATPAPSPGPSPAAPPTADGHVPTPMAPPPAPRTPRLPAASVPVVLLALGGLCLLVAAIVFVAVAWGSLSLGAKTLIMLAVTGLAAAAATSATRRDLQVAAETLWLLVAGLVTLDLAAAYGADLFGLGRIDDRHAVALIGASLLGLAVGVGAWATTTAIRRLHGLVMVAAAGIALLAGAEAWLSDHNPAALAVSVPLVLALAWGIDRVTDQHLRPTAGAVAAAALVSWLLLVGHGLDRLDAAATDRAWWSDLVGWPLLVAAVLAAATTAPVKPRPPEWARVVLAGAALVTFGVFLTGPGTGPTADLLAWAGVSALLALTAGLAPLTWARAAAVLTALGLVVWSSLALVRPYEVLSLLPTTGRPDHHDLDLVLPAAPSGPAPWTALVVVLVVGALAAGLLRHVPGAGAREQAGRSLIGLGPTVLALGAVTGLLETRPTLGVAVLAWAAVLAVGGAMAVTVRHQPVSLLVALVLLLHLVVTGLRLAVPSHLLAALLATVVAGALALAYARAPRGLLDDALLPVLAASAVVTGAFAATHWPYVAGGHGDAAGVTLAIAAGVALLVARPAGRDRASRWAAELAALGAGLVATQLPLDDGVVAIVLTIVGSTLALVAILESDREAAGWLAVVVLGAATLLRIVEDVRAPEAAALPAAALLVGAGWWRLGKDPRLSSARALGSGLTLGLLPSLLLAVDEPVSLRGALVAAAGVAVLAVGVVRRWTAPFVAGALTTAVLAVCHLGPVAQGVPRWVSLGAVGLALLVVGITWEQRRRDLRVAVDHLTALR